MTLETREEEEMLAKVRSIEQKVDRIEKLLKEKAAPAPAAPTQPSQQQPSHQQPSHQQPQTQTSWR